MSLNRTTLSVIILLVIMAVIGWLVLTPTENMPSGDRSRALPPATQVAPNNPGPTTGTP